MNCTRTCRVLCMVCPSLQAMLLSWPSGGPGFPLCRSQLRWEVEHWTVVLPVVLSESFTGTWTHDGSMSYGILMLTWLGYIDGIHGTPYIAAPWIRHGELLEVSRTMISSYVFVMTQNVPIVADLNWSSEKIETQSFTIACYHVVTCQVTTLPYQIRWYPII